MANKVYDYVTQEIIKRLKEDNIAPWQKPWSIGNQVNYVTQKAYRGVNTLLLKKSGEYLTFNQIKEKGGILKKGSKSEMVIFFKPVEKFDKNAEKNEEKENQSKYVILRYYRVFHLSDVEGLESKLKPKKNNNPILEAENILKNYEDRPEIRNIENDKAYYHIYKDYINIPGINYHTSSENYYSTVFHEAIHSTGNKKRLGRFKENEIMHFGSNTYSKEELIAEIGAAMLCGIAGIVDKTINNSVSYLDNWIKQLENDSALIVKAAAAAQKAADYIVKAETTNHDKVSAKK